MADINGPIRVFEEGGTIQWGSDNVLNVESGTLEWTPGLWEKKDVMDRGTMRDPRIGGERPTKVKFAVKFSSMAAATGLYELICTKGTTGTYKQFSVVVKIKDHIDATTGESITFAKLCVDSVNFKSGAEFDRLEIEATDYEANPVTTTF